MSVSLLTADPPVLLVTFHLSRYPGVRYLPPALSLRLCSPNEQRVLTGFASTWLWLSPSAPAESSSTCPPPPPPFCHCVHKYGNEHYYMYYNSLCSLVLSHWSSGQQMTDMIRFDDPKIGLKSAGSWKCPPEWSLTSIFLYLNTTVS